jgi:hypothetical protein
VGNPSRAAHLFLPNHPALDEGRIATPRIVVASFIFRQPIGSIRQEQCKRYGHKASSAARFTISAWPK